MSMSPIYRALAIGIFTLGLTSCTVPESTLSNQNGEENTSAQTISALESGFINPPRSARPQTWFHAMSGNMSKVGITKDLEALSDAGIKGTLLFNVTQGVPYGRVLFNSDEHLELIGHMAKESKRLNLDFGIHNSDGWTSSGGPWVTPEQAMKKVVWTQKVVKGGNIKLAMPQAEAIRDYYEDIALLAYPSLPTDISDTQKPVIKSSDKNFNANVAADGKILTHSKIYIKEGQEGWLQFSYKQPFTLRALNLFTYEARSKNFYLKTSDDGVNFTQVRKLALQNLGKRIHGIDETFDGITAKHFRIVTDREFKIQEAGLSSTPRVDRYLSRTSRARTEFSKLKPLANPPKEHIVQSSQIINLSKNMNNKGLVSATLPPGNWTLLRFGYTTTGATNYPASESGRGLEVDKFSREAFKHHYNEFVGRVLNKVNKVAPGALKTVEIDSYEVGGQNWTQGMADIFQKKYDYDLTKYLPLYTGRFVDSAQTSELVLNDIRALNGELVVENYFGYFAELAHADGLKAYLEPYGHGPFNDMDAAAKADIPMGEFWLKRSYRHITSLVSTAHTNNKPVVSAEAFTAKRDINWHFHPGMAKIDGDKAFSQGINEMVFHRYAHQANTHVMPGMIMSQWGANFDRTQAWWDISAKSWVKNISRNQFMLRQGLPSSDILLFIGDGAPTTCLERHKQRPKIPNYLTLDCVSPDVLKNRFTAENNRLVLPEGTSYKILYLTNSKQITLESLRKINTLSSAGIVVVGNPPTSLLPKSLKQMNAKSELNEFNALVENIWARPTTHKPSNWSEIFEKSGLTPGLKVTDNEKIFYARRKTPNEDIYFIVNEDKTAQTLEVFFEVDGKLPELWNPVTGERKKVGQFSHINGQTVMTLKLPAQDSTFVVFRQSSKGITYLPHNLSKATESNIYLSEKNTLYVESDKNGKHSAITNTSKTIAAKIDSLSPPQNIDGPWKVRFDPTYGYGETLIFDKLIDWKDHPSDDIKYYTGKATYSNTFTLKPSHFAPNKKLILNLGKVSVAAHVFINGEDAGIAWTEPYQLDVSNIVKPGKNAVTIEVANLWVNRFIGDQNHPDTTGFKQSSYLTKPDEVMPAWYVNNEPPPPGKRIAFSTRRFQKKGDPLVSSGLIGPVRVMSLVAKPIK